VHGVLDRAMKMLEIPCVSSTGNKAAPGYYLKETNGKLPFLIPIDSTIWTAVQIQCFSLDGQPE
jgi:hypothetical protein